jgi:hypothetical protein
MIEGKSVKTSITPDIDNRPIMAMTGIIGSTTITIIKTATVIAAINKVDKVKTTNECHRNHDDRLQENSRSPHPK